MNDSHLYERCAGFTPHCWTSSHTAFVARRQRILRQATEVFGERSIAEHWLVRPAMGLGHFAPCSLLVQYESYIQVRDFLYRVEYGVYT